MFFFNKFDKFVKINSGIGITSAESRPHNHLQVRGNISASTSIFAESTIQAGGNITASGDIKTSGLYVTSSGATNVIQVGATGAGGIQKWEWHRDGSRKFVL